MNRKKKIFILISTILFFSSIIGGLVLVRRSQETRRGAESCSGWCNKDGCSNDCPDVWPVSFYCRGKSDSACNERHGSFLGYGVPAGTIEYGENVKVKKDDEETFISSWCTTVQADSNSPDSEAIVVFIGDNGEYCVEGTGCDPDDLDWDCQGGPEETPTPTTTPPDLGCDFNCIDLYAIDESGNQIVDSELEELKPQEICFEIQGWTNCDQGISKARFQVTGWDNWESGDYDREENDPGSNGEYYYYRWCHDFSDEVTSSSCSDIDAEVCVEGVCR